MGTVAISSILNRASIILHDIDAVRWTLGEMVEWASDAQRETVMFKPSAYARNENLKLVAGTKQTIPAEGLQLLDVVRNMGDSGLDVGRAIRVIEREILDANDPDWHSADTSDVIKHFTYAANDPKTFYVYPPSDGVGYVEVVFSAVPPTVSLNGTLAIDDIYQGAVLDYILYRAYQKDAEYAADPSRAANHYQSFVSALLGRSKSEKTENPNADPHSNPIRR